MNNWKIGEQRERLNDALLDRYLDAPRFEDLEDSKEYEAYLEWKAKREQEATSGRS